MYPYPSIRSTLWFKCATLWVLSINWFPFAPYGWYECLSAGIMAPVLEGICTGLLLSLMVGPVLFLLLETSIVHGRVSALSLEMGMILSDVMWVALIYFGAFSRLSELGSLEYLSFLGAGLFIAFGFANIVGRNRKRNTPSKRWKYNNNLVKGFLINTFNPTVALVWIGVMSVVAERYGDAGQLLAYFSATIGSLLLADSVKILLAFKLRKFVSASVASRISILTGLVFIGAGFLLLAKSFKVM